MKQGTCPKCSEHKDLTRHHVLPKTHFGNTQVIELICRDCHNDLEYFIQKHEGRNRKGKRNRLPAKQYYWLYTAFLAI